MIRAIGIKKTEIEIVDLNGAVSSQRFQDEISRVLISEGKVIVSLNYMDYSKTLGNRNIFCLNEKAEIIWKIQDPDDRVGDGQKTNAPFVDIKIHDGKLLAGTWPGFTYVVDSETGKLIESLGWSK